MKEEMVNGAILDVSKEAKQKSEGHQSFLQLLINYKIALINWVQYRDQIQAGSEDWFTLLNAYKKSYADLLIYKNKNLKG